MNSIVTYLFLILMFGSGVVNGVKENVGFFHFWLFTMTVGSGGYLFGYCWNYLAGCLK